ncbi:hypothetical protein HN803_05255 [candidate division WWE3 bacterium]|jgi:hypothetical protein|nr:hypothetical protein [candidate division WWE3 bacterium]
MSEDNVKVKIIEAEWQLGFDDGLKGKTGESVVDEYSYSAGWIEGEAERLKRKETADSVYH